MKTGFYPRLALTGIRKNRTMYLPYFLTCVLMVAVYYILSFLGKLELMEHMSGGDSLQFTLNLGSYVIAIFSVLFLFYTNSFLIRRRKKEFGLYNVLGMHKRNIARILLWETLMVAFASLTCGLAIGIALSKLSELVLVNLVGGDVTYSFFMDFPSMWQSAALYGAIFLLIFLNALRQLHFSNPAELLRSENVGEKPPKANWLLGLLGVIILGCAYCLAVTIEDPLEAMVWFFVAVIMVIVSTYLLFISGSVLLCKILQKSKRYYYKPRHFVSVSSMAYRMKRNGAGLASVCILATMVLVMLSSSTCMYFGVEDSLQSRYPRQITARIDFSSPERMNEENLSELRVSLLGAAEKAGAEVENILDYRQAQVYGLFCNGELQLDQNALNHFEVDSFSDVAAIYLVPLDDYNRMMGTREVLADDEAMVYLYRMADLPDKLRIADREYTVVKRLDNFFGSGVMTDVLPKVYVVVKDPAALTEVLGSYVGVYNLCWYFGFDPDADKQDAVYEAVRETLRDLAIKDQNDFYCYSLDDREEVRDDFYGTYGGLFFIGIMLSLVFLVATVLIIYYKQLSEGYEDQTRFDIMQRVGMTKTEISKSIHSQMLTVFFLPLLFSALHLAFAFPMIRKMLLLFDLNNLPLLLLTTGISIGCFALFYMIIYRTTSNAYIGIVSGAKE